MIEINALHFSRLDGTRPRPILQDLSLSLPAGAQCSLVGDSGTGKTTLLNLLAGLEPCQRGEVNVMGQSLVGRSATELALYRRHIGIVFQQFQLLESLSILDNLLLPHRLLGRSGKPLRLEALAEALGIDHLMSRLPNQLSGGEQQRVAVCRALVHEPGLVLADEPTGNLDESNSHKVVSQLKRLAREQGSTVVMVTHSQSLASGFEYQLRLHNGQLHQADRP
ncbi:ABC transporter ATP-binding protein [Ferrimonas balearica]|uniref:ABC transporter ATP-binding protein n=1 Tax=Ferrimonas balearica TaxID=44012 RepID=UPI001C96FA42|nr:ABC transporter ATP-binding protein [Ferrimonas balearica]MBY5981071.1 ABC transporter ATP-binding protein [Ferrimonas balearica]